MSESVLGLIRDTRRGLKRGPAVVAQRQRTRFVSPMLRVLRPGVVKARKAN